MEIRDEDVAGLQSALRSHGRIDAGVALMEFVWPRREWDMLGSEMHLLRPSPLSAGVIRHAVWLYLRFTLSYRDVEVLAEKGLEVSNESIRRWVLKFGSAIARNLRSIRPRPHNHWHLDEMVVSIGGQRMYMWRAVDGEGEVLDVLIQRSRDKAAALKLLRKLLKKPGFAPAVMSPTNSGLTGRR
jgi:DDE domain